MNITEAQSFIVSRLQSSGGESPKVDAEFLLCHLMAKSRTWLKTWPDYELSLEQVELLKDYVGRREKGEPIAYITGVREFWTLELETNTSTLIPRPETDLLVELAIEYLNEHKKTEKAKVLDLGTGTGAIALAIASERKMDEVYASDFSTEAVALASRNALRNKIDNVTVLKSSWFQQLDVFQLDLICF